MKLTNIVALSFVLVATVCFTQGNPQIITFDQIFPRSVQKNLGLHKLTAEEKEALRSHVQTLFTRVLARNQDGGAYAGGGGGHWVQKNVDSGTYMILEDGSLWQIDPIDKIDAMLWLPISEITVVESTSGSPGLQLSSGQYR